MKKKFKLGVIGAGFMASAIINGAINSKIVNAKDVIVSDVNEESLSKIAKLGVYVTKNNVEVAENSDFLLFAVKPQNFVEVAKGIACHDISNVISIMAGVKKEKIKDNLNSNVKVARCMPNTPCSIGCGAVGIDLSDFDNKIDKEFVENLFKSFAVTVLVDEDKLGAVTAISGSSPAYFYMFINALVKAGIKNGLKKEDALKLAVNTMIGSGKMIFKNEDKSLEELISAVCSKGGTTIEAVNVFNDCDLDGVVEKAFDACLNRSIELENV